MNFSKLTMKSNKRRSVIEELMQSSLPDQEKQDERVQQECGAIVAAGIDTVAWSKFQSF